MKEKPLICNHKRKSCLFGFKRVCRGCYQRLVDRRFKRRYENLFDYYKRLTRREANKKSYQGYKEKYGMISLYVSIKKSNKKEVQGYIKSRIIRAILANYYYKNKSFKGIVKHVNSKLKEEWFVNMLSLK